MSFELRSVFHPHRSSTGEALEGRDGSFFGVVWAAAMTGPQCVWGRKLCELRC